MISAVPRYPIWYVLIFNYCYVIFARPQRSITKDIARHTGLLSNCASMPERVRTFILTSSENKHGEDWVPATRHSYIKRGTKIRLFCFFQFENIAGFTEFDLENFEFSSYNWLFSRRSICKIENQTSNPCIWIWFEQILLLFCIKSIFLNTESFVINTELRRIGTQTKIEMKTTDSGNKS